jgi:hypothetical protein
MSESATKPSKHRKHQGTCHCGDVRFEVELDTSHGAGRCNCTICTKIGATGAIVKPSAFTLLSPKDEASLGEYAWGMKISRRFFCKRCGIHCFARGHLEQLGGDYVSVNLNCVDDVDTGLLKVTYWDGRHNNWEAGTRDTPWPIESRA